MLSTLSIRRIYIGLVGAYWWTLSLTFPVITLYLLSCGLSLVQVGIVTAVSSTCHFVFNIPAGYLSDKLNHRLVFFVGLFLHALSMLIISAYTDFYLILYGYSIWGIGRAFFSSTLESWLVNHLKSRKEELKIIATFQTGWATTAFSIAFGIFIFFILINDSSIIEISRYIFLTSSALMLILGILSLFLLKNCHKSNSIKKKEYFKHSKIIKYFKSLSFLKYICLAIGYGVALGFLEVFWLPIGLEAGLHESYVTIIYAFAYFFSGLALILLIRNRYSFNQKTFISISRLLLAGCFLGLALVYNSYGFGIFIIFVYVIIFLEAPIIHTEFNREIDNRERTLLLSVESSARQGSAIFSKFVFSSVFSQYGIKWTLIWISMLLLITCIPYFMDLGISISGRKNSSKSARSY